MVWESFLQGHLQGSGEAGGERWTARASISRRDEAARQRRTNFQHETPNVQGTAKGAGADG